MTQKSANDNTRQDALDRFQHFLDEEERRRGQDDPQAAFEAYWSRARAALFVNTCSTGRDTLDAVIAAVWNGEDPTEAWTGPVNLIPPLSRQREVVVVEDGEFRLGVKRSAEAVSSESAGPPSKKAKSKREAKSGKLKSAKASTEGEPGEAAADNKASVNGARGKAATTATPAQSDDEEEVEEAQTADLPTLGFELAEGVPRQIRKDLFRVFHRAATKDKPPFRLAYPWSGVHLWYDPAKYPSVHLAHWRFWNAHRPTFWQCAIHPPLPAGARQNYYRKQKMKACRARLQFLSICIEAWGYVAFLKLLDEGSTRLLWLGGRPGRHSPNGTKANDGVDQDLAALFMSDRERYHRRIKAALDPKKIDEDGFTSVVDLLLQTSALDPDKDAQSRLSDRALARVCADLVAEKPFDISWVPDALKPMYKKVRNHPRILTVTMPDKLFEPKVPPYKPKESRTPGFSPFLNAKTNAYTATAPRKGGTVTFPSSSPSGDKAVSTKGGDRNSKAVNKSQPKSTEVASVPKVKRTVTAKELFGDGDSGSDGENSDAVGDTTVTAEEEAIGADSNSDSEAEEDSKPPPPSPTAVKRATKTRSSSKSS